MNQHSSSKPRFFFYLILLTIFFILLEISFFIQCNRMYLYDFSFVTDQLHIPATVLPGIYYFIAAQFTIHFLYCFWVWMVVYLNVIFFNLKSQHVLLFAISVWVLGILTACTTNQYYFPNSKFSELTAIFLVTTYLTKMMFGILWTLVSLLVLFALLGIVKIFYKKTLFYFSILTGILALSGFTFHKTETPVHAHSFTRPNIIIIGVDSLRPDYLSYFGHKPKTPFFDSFLNTASVFSNAITPLARTFPSWTSILTGLYPREMGARTNLMSLKQVKLNFSIAAALQKEGYETIYATDETRFSNIDQSFGFDQIISPPMGLNDFLIGTFNDFPLSNLLINTVLGKWLFPHSFGNRPVYFSYDPNSFLNLLKPILKPNKNKPLFLAVHFCLPHFPYLWSGLNGFDYDVHERYEKSIQRVDQQIKEFYILLKEAHLLEHAIVVLLSDHGEALELDGDRITEEKKFISEHSNPLPRFYPPSLENEAINQSVGHGTDVLGLSQYRTLLAFKLYGFTNWKPRVINDPVTLLDIKPTLLAFLNYPVNNVSGVSLVKVIKGDIHLKRKEEHFFLESDFSPEAIHTLYPETRKVLLDGVELFQINPYTTRLTVKDDMVKMIINAKQFADIYHGWMLALYPQPDHTNMPILINLKTGEWTNDLKTSFAKRAPTEEMLNKLKFFYGNEIHKLKS